MRYFILFCVASCFAGGGEVRADSPDCDTIRTSLVPYQIKLTKERSVWRELHTIQVVRNPSGSDSISTRVTSTTSYKTKSISLNGSRTVSDRQHFRGESNSRIEHATIEYEGIDLKQVDYRIDQNFVFKEKFERIDGKEAEFVRSFDVSYKYRNTDNIPIGPCTFIAHLGETTLTDRKTSKAEKFFSWHFPDLRLLVGNPGPNVVFQSISTAFEPIELAEPNWPLRPQTANDH